MREIGTKEIRFSSSCFLELLTTPQLHYAVQCYNRNGAHDDYTETGYFNKLCPAFRKLIEVKNQFFMDYSNHLVSVDDFWSEM